MKNGATLYIDQNGTKFHAKTLKDLRKQIPGRCSIMYEDSKDGKTYRVGYVIGDHWLRAYKPFRQEA